MSTVHNPTTTTLFPPLPSTTALSSSSSPDTTDGEDETTLTSLESSILSSYLHHSDATYSDVPPLSKIRSLLSSSRHSSFIPCLICLERVRPSHPTWSCSLSCHALFHLPCIQSWARQCFSLSSSSSSSKPPPIATWHCPKCRLTYPKDQLPTTYLCYCAKLQNPPPDPWILPHSCGDVCGKPLLPACGHHCLLLCHPGPCPPCPKTVPSLCFCGRSEDVRRCAAREFSCGKPCTNLASCRAHRCVERCHVGDCPPCKAKGQFRCDCGKVVEERECWTGRFRCERECDCMLTCGKHRCERGCHAGECGECPLQGRRTCPCGKKVYRGMACDAILPSCGETCEKVLSCGKHRCPERCHRGPCVETCRTIAMKECRCGSLKKEVPCYQELVCERKCQRTRDCGRHACKRRCCYGDCPPCPEICGRKLRCNNHKCPAPCHRGACAPCPLVVSISCLCGETTFEVPCGMEKDQKPPKCLKACEIPRLCRHSLDHRKHKCHYGACPPCRKICNQEFPCGHTCKQRCHGPVPPANPEFSLKPKKKRHEKQNECKPGPPCPPCQEIVLRPCLGQHFGEERPMLCYDKKRHSCQNLCGNLLLCGNHYCTKPCHVLRNMGINADRSLENAQNLAQENEKLAEACEDCVLPCQKERKPLCPHPCSLSCHRHDCPPCEALIKRTCHCGSMVHVFDCTYFNSLSHQEQLNVRSCGGHCHRKLPSCPHLCSDICHPGDCPSPHKCRKKVTVRCACHNLKREWICVDVQNAYLDNGLDPKKITRNQYGVGILSCNPDCLSKRKVDDSEIVLRKIKTIESKVTTEVKTMPKRRKRRECVIDAMQVSKYQVLKDALWKSFLYLCVASMLVLCLYYCYKGIYLLSDWMYEVENHRKRNSFPRI